jgi:hypothetical protein
MIDGQPLTGEHYPVMIAVLIFSCCGIIIPIRDGRIAKTVKIKRRECEANNCGKWREVSSGRWKCSETNRERNHFETCCSLWFLPDRGFY